MMPDCTKRIKTWKTMCLLYAMNQIYIRKLYQQMRRRKDTIIL